MQICWASKVLQLLLEGRGKSEDEGLSALGPVPHRTRVNWLSTPEGTAGRKSVSTTPLWRGGSRVNSADGRVERRRKINTGRQYAVNTLSIHSEYAVNRQSTRREYTVNMQ